MFYKFIKKLTYFLSIMLFLISHLSFGQSLTFEDMRNFIEVGSGASWTYPDGTGGRTAIQANNTGNPVYLVSPDSGYLNDVFKGTIEVNAGDDDDIGFAFGFNGDDDTYIWSWDQGGIPQGVRSGGAHLLYKKTWSGYNSNLSGKLIAKGPNNDPWSRGTKYQIEILYTANRVKLNVNGVTKFDVTASDAGISEFPPGQFGFYNFSQGGVTFGNIQKAPGSDSQVPPTAKDDLYGISPNTTLTVDEFDGILKNDYDANLDNYTIVLVSDVSNGNLSLDLNDGSFSYTPSNGYEGADEFTYKLVQDDDDLESTERTVTIGIINNNQSPTDIQLTNNQISEGAANNTSVGLLSTTDTNNPSDQHDYSLDDNAGGRFTLNGNVLVVANSSSLTPNDYTITVRTTDLFGASYTEDFTISVISNAKPTSSNSNISIRRGTTYTFDGNEFSFNDSDGDTFGGIRIETAETAGDLEYDGADIFDGTIINNISLLSFTSPSSSSAGPFSTVVYKVIDSRGGISTASYSLNISIAQENINQASIATIADLIYTGTAQTVSPTVTFNSLTLDEGTDYTTSFTGNTDAGTASITLTGIGNYTGTKTQGFNITSKTLTITAGDKTKVYDSAVYTPTDYTVTYDGFENSETESALSGTLTFTGTALTATNSGTYVITPGGFTSSNYSITYVSGVLSITPATLTITANTLSKTYGDIDPSLTHTTIGLISGDTFTGTLTRTAGEDVGSYTISNDNLTYGSNYTEFFEAGTLTITTKAVTVTAGTQTKVHGDIDPELTYSVSPEGINTTLSNNSSTITFTGSLSRTTGDSSEDAGTYSITIGTLTNTNFDITFVPANLTITKLPVTVIPTASQSKTYGEIDPTLTYTTAPTLNSTLTNTTSTITFTGSLSRTTGENIDDYMINIGTLTNTNYEITLSPETFAINKKTITVSGITAEDKVYDGTTTSTLDLSGITFTGKKAEDTITATVTGTFDSKDIGTSKTVSLTASYSSTALDNYTIIPQTTTTASITAKPVYVSGDTGIDKTFDNTTNLPIGEIGYGALTGVLTGEDVALSGVGEYDAVTAGSRNIVIGTVTLTGADKGNYALNWTNGSGTIAKKTLTVTANNDAKFVTEGDTSGYNGVSYTGFEGDDSISDINISGLIISRTNSTTNTAAGSYPGTLVPAGVTATNYSISYVNGDYTIIPADKLLLKVTNQTTTYGTAATYSITSAQYYKTGTGPGTGVQTVTTSAINATQYTVNDGASTINIEIVPDSPVNSSAGKLSVGTYGLSANVVSGSSGNFSNNIEVIGNHSVAKQSLTASASSVSKEYDATTAMTGVRLSLATLETADVVTVNGTGSFSSPNVGTGLSYTIAGLSLSGTDANNYYLSAGASFSGSNGVITKAPLSITANNDNGVDTDPAYSGGNGVIYSGFKGTDSETDLSGTLTYTGTSQGAIAAGSYAIEPTGITSSNYSITFVAGTLTIIVGDSDGDGVRDPSDNCPTTANPDQADADGDGIGDVCDNAPNIPNPDQRDTDGDGIGDVADTDDDNDGCLDTSDAFPLDPSECSDNDGDGIGDNADPDDDNDSVLDSLDNCPTTPNTDQKDTDGDGAGDVCDNDTDNDGMSDDQEAACGTDPLDPQDTPVDTDNDGIPDCIDTDKDNDGYQNINDAFPLDKDEHLDTDADGIGNNADTDDDNDGQSDEEEVFCGTDPLDASSFSGDVDNDGISDCRDQDNDNDGVNDAQDAFPLDPSEWKDTDADGTGNNADEDDDNDGYSDLDELECNSDPLDKEDLPADLDQDGIPDCKDTDIDGDGCINTGDVFPRDPSECEDTDGDGLGNNVDVDDDNDGVIDQDDAFPLDPSESKDADNDGIGDNADPDDNNDGFDDAELQVSGVLTPNSSGLESTWKIINLDKYPNARVTVYNKNGQEVFSAQGYRNDWRGTYKNSENPLPAASYYYVIQLNTGEEPVSGWMYITY